MHTIWGTNMFVIFHLDPLDEVYDILRTLRFGQTCNSEIRMCRGVGQRWRGEHNTEVAESSAARRLITQVGATDWISFTKSHISIFSFVKSNRNNWLF